MTLAVPYPVYGFIYEGGSPVSGANVHARDETDDQGVADYTTCADGKFQINLQDNATDGSTIRVFAFYDGKYKHETFTIDISEGAKRVDLTVEQQSISDKVWMSDNQSKVASFNRSLSNIIWISDDYSQVASFNRSLNDNVWVSDDYSQVVSFNISLSDIVWVSDDYSQIASFNRSLSDIVWISDNLESLKAFVVSISDSVKLTDNLTKVGSFNRSLSDKVWI